jgi:hypothetical protein
LLCRSVVDIVVLADDDRRVVVDFVDGLNARDVVVNNASSSNATPVSDESARVIVRKRGPIGIQFGKAIFGVNAKDTRPKGCAAKQGVSELQAKKTLELYKSLDASGLCGSRHGSQVTADKCDGLCCVS